MQGPACSWKQWPVQWITWLAYACIANHNLGDADVFLSNTPVCSGLSTVWLQSEDWRIYCFKVIPRNDDLRLPIA